MWDKLNYSNITEIAPLTELPVSCCPERFCHWVTQHPLFREEFFIAVRSGVTHNQQLVCFTLSYPFTMQFGKISDLKVMCLKVGTNLKYLSDQIISTLYKETMRIANLHGISQAVMAHYPTRIITPFARISRWQFEFSCMSLPWNNIITPGWRKMTKKDIPYTLALTNNYTSQFEIRQVFKSNSEFSHYFLCPNISNYISTYVVEDQRSGEITDMIGFRVEIVGSTGTCAYVTAIISTKTPVRQLLANLLICAE